MLDRVPCPQLLLKGEDLRLATAAIVLALALLAASSSAAQSLCYDGGLGPATRRASSYLPLEHWAYRYIDLLIARGRLTGLDPMVQPYRRIDVARAIYEAERNPDLAAAERDWFRELKRELEREFHALADTSDSAPYVNGAVSGGTWAMTQRHRDVLRPEGERALFPFAAIEAAGEFPNVVAELRFRWDEWLLNDPQFPDGKVVENHPNFLGLFDFGARTEEGYLELQIPYLRALVGRTYRNWALPGADGLLVSGYSYSYDQVAYRVGVDCLNVIGFVAQLDEFPGSVKRYTSSHRLNWRPRANLALAVGESVIYGGENRSFDLRISNPISIWLVGGFGEDYRDGPNSNNNFTELSAWWRPFDWLVTSLSLMIDDFPGGGTPAQYAGALGIQFPRLGSRWSLRFDYSQVAALTYRTAIDHQIFAFRDVGLGRDISDSDLFSLQLDWIPHYSLILRPVVQVLRRGEGDFRDPWPDGVTQDGPTLFIGEVETTARLALAGQWVPSTWVWLEWDIGQNFVQDAGNVPGANKSEFVGRVFLSARARGWGAL